MNRYIDANSTKLNTTSSINLFILIITTRYNSIYRVMLFLCCHSTKITGHTFPRSDSFNKIVFHDSHTPRGVSSVQFILCISFSTKLRVLRGKQRSKQNHYCPTRSHKLHHGHFVNGPSHPRFSLESIHLL